ncbi:unnamed protein product [Rhizophagus irregularis]|nr:unnamed protein product [Rhizophagus irregularis]
MFSYHQFLVVVNRKINSEFPTIATPFGTSADTFSGISGGNLGGSLGENFGGSEWIDTLGGIIGIFEVIVISRVSTILLTPVFAQTGLQPSIHLSYSSRYNVSAVVVT